MPASRRSVVLVASLACLAVGSRLGAQQVVRLTPASGRVAIWNLIGTVRVEQGTSDDVEVEVTRLGAHAGQLVTRTGVLDGAQTLRIFHPADVIRAADEAHAARRYSTTIRLRDDGRFGMSGGDGRRVRLSHDGGAEASADLVVRVPAGVSLELHLGLGDIAARGTMRALSLETGSGTIRTGETRGPLRLETGSGAVAVTRHDGDLDVETGSGSVTASDIDGATAVRIESGSGALSVVRCRATDHLALETGSGRISALGIEAASMRLETGSGSVEVAPRSSAGDLDVETGSGSVTLIAPDDFNAELRLSAGSGGVESAVPMAVSRRERGELDGRIGTGRSRVTIETGSGGVLVRPASIRRTI
ncbi:MAG: DUF4097 family beta strand repeat protein [Gemmatimonadaceae bacterium]|nr:DUF4097 family beta strand repeat protein [Gemmatimonadaceae bacterium]